MKYCISCQKVDELKDAARKLIEVFPERRVFAFYGEMGAGKTTFIKSICKYLGVEDIVNSPTFSIINEYKTASGESIFHFDFYRIEKQEEVFDIGFEEYVYSGDHCFIEWPEKIEELLPDDCVYVKIEVGKDNAIRNILF